MFVPVLGQGLILPLFERCRERRQAWPRAAPARIDALLELIDKLRSERA